MDNKNKKHQLLDDLREWSKSKEMLKVFPELPIILCLYLDGQIGVNMILYYFRGRELFEKDKTLAEESKRLCGPLDKKILEWLQFKFSPFRIKQFIHTGEGLDIISFDGETIQITPQKIIDYSKATRNYPILYDEVDLLKAEFKAKERRMAKLYNSDSINGLEIKYTKEQLCVIFDGMVKQGNFKQSQKQHFYDLCQGKIQPGKRHIEWLGDKSLIRYFMVSITGKDIKPKEISEYIAPKINSNDKHTGGSHYPIKRIFDKLNEPQV